MVKRGKQQGLCKQVEQDCESHEESETTNSEIFDDDVASTNDTVEVTARNGNDGGMTPPEVDEAHRTEGDETGFAG